MQKEIVPFNLGLLSLGNEDIKNIRPVKVLDIFDGGGSKNFHPDGLFSIETFGRVGEERRNRLFSYINLNIDILHPVIFKSVVDLKALYGDIINSKEYAVFNTEIGDFEKSDIVNGSTGYSFFIKHLRAIKFELRDSPKRQFNIKLIEKFKDKLFIDKLVVMPAGLRDYVIDANGKPSQDEINKLYVKVIAISSMIGNVDTKLNESYLDSARANLQSAVDEIYEYIKAMMEGKSKLIQSKWAGRKIFNSTRNVITTNIPKITSLDDPRNISTNQTSVSLYQYLRMTLPLAVKHIRDTYLSSVFVGSNSPSVLVNKKTLKRELVNIDPEHYDEWMTYEGLEKVCARFGEDHLRHEPLEVEDYYIGLIYKGNDKTFKFIQDIDDVPENRRDDGSTVTPITFAELMYLSIYRDSDSIPCFVTRYPVAGYGGIYPSYCYLMSTVNSEVRYELNDDWEVIATNPAKEFPVTGANFFNSMAPSNAHIKRLVADFDGDMCSATAVLSEESKLEIKTLLNSRNYYVGINGKMNFSASSDIINLTLKSMTS